MNFQNWHWLNEPQDFHIGKERISITTRPHTDLWQRTYYHFQNDNAAMWQTETERDFFSFTVKTGFGGSRRRFDQCGIVLYLDSQNWLKASVEYENERFGHLGSVVTDGGYSDWATTPIDAGITDVWYRLSRRGADFRIESSLNGRDFTQMRICHLAAATGKIRFGIYACSPEASSFTAYFSQMRLSDCQWPAHDGQQPD